VAVLSLAIGLTLLAVMKSDAYVDNDVKRRGLITTLLMIAFFLITVYVNIYRIKSPWY